MLFHLIWHMITAWEWCANCHLTRECELGFGVPYRASIPPVKRRFGKRKNRKTCYKMSLVTWSELWIKRKSERALSMAKIKSELWIRIATPTELAFPNSIECFFIGHFLFFIYLFYISIFDYSFTNLY